MTSYDYHILQKKAEEPTKINNKFSLQIYSAKDLRKMLARCGFKILEQYDIDGSKFLTKKSLSILTIAQKSANKMKLRKYRPQDINELVNIYYHTIHNINIRDYSKEQINAWAPESCLELEGWKKK